MAEMSGHVRRNTQARLNAAPRPSKVVTSLQVSTPPLADSARYDTLRQGLDSAQEVGHA
jgi:hypothetical protein